MKTGGIESLERDGLGLFLDFEGGPFLPFGLVSIRSGDAVRRIGAGGGVVDEGERVDPSRRWRLFDDRFGNGGLGRRR